MYNKLSYFIKNYYLKNMIKKEINTILRKHTKTYKKFFISKYKNNHFKYLIKKYL